MKNIIGTALLVLALAPQASAETRALTGFHRVSASSGQDVEISVGPGFSVNVEGPGADQVVTRVDADTLRVEPIRGWHWGRRPRALVRVTMPSLTGLEASSGAEINAAGIDADVFSAEASSGADIAAAGACRELSVETSSGADINARDLHCGAANVDASSGSHAAVFIDGVLNVDASSGGDVVASGQARIGDISLSSGGSLHRR